MQGQIYRKYPFWSLAGPFLGFLAIQTGVQFIIQFAIELPYLLDAYTELMRETAAGSIPAAQEIMDVYVQTAAPALRLIAAHQVEIAAAASGATLVLTGILFAKDRKLEKRCGMMPPGRASAGKYWMLLVFGAAGSPAATCLMAMAQAAFADNAYQQTSADVYAASFPVQVICLGILIPLAEEMMFRGILYKRYRERQDFWYSALCSAILFSFMHTNMTQMIYTFLLGLMLAYVYEKFGSFCAPLILHILMNTVSLVLTWAGGFAFLSRDPLLLAAAAVGGAFICSVMFVLIQRIRSGNTDPNIG